MLPYYCGKGCGVDLKLMGDGNWKCPSCGTVIASRESDEDDNDGEALSIWDAADIYLSHGCDEDYSFGYTHEELMKASGNS